MALQSLRLQYALNSLCKWSVLSSVRYDLHRTENRIESHGQRNVSHTKHITHKSCRRRDDLCRKADRLLSWHTCKRSYSTYGYCHTNEKEHHGCKIEFISPQPDLDWDYISDPANKQVIQQNIQDRKGVGCIERVHELLKKHSDLQSADGDDASSLGVLKCELLDAALLIPNQSHPNTPIGDESQALTMYTFGEEHSKGLSHKTKSVVEIGQHLDALRISDVSLTTGHSTYYFKGPFAVMEQALIRYTTDKLRRKGFKMMSVPDLLYPEIIEGCGFKTTGERNQVYRLDPVRYGDICLSGTGEMPLAGFFMNQTLARDDLPQRVMTVSRCYRAETSNLEEEGGIYRVHQFTKVEMFGVTAQETGTESEELMEEFLQIQKELFEPLGICFRILEMPTHELGAPAYRKYDVEAWMSAKRLWGEISSTSNCTDFQTRRLLIKSFDKDGRPKYCHTVNGTACAVPRMIMAIVEANQQEDMSVKVPPVLQPYMDNIDHISVPDDTDIMKPIKFSKTLVKNLHR